MDLAFAASTAASAVAQLWNGYRQRQQSAEFEERREMQQMKVIRMQHRDALERLDLQNEFTQSENRVAHEENWRRQKDQQQHNEKLQRDSWQLARLAESYPIKRGPFYLRRHLQLCYPVDFPKYVPPVVLIQPLMDESNRGTWANARLHSQQLLGSLYDDRLVHVPQGLPDRAFTWPDADFYQLDLLDIPTIIVSATAAPSGVNIWLGGSHLLPKDQEIWPFAPSRPVLSITTASLYEYVKQHQIGKPEGANLPMAVVKSDKSLDPNGAQWLMMEYVSRGIELCVTKMVDTYHLLRQECYDERFDAAVGRSLAPAEAARLADNSLDPPIESIKDPAYHLLHRARRSLRAGNIPGATKNILDAFSQIEKQLSESTQEIGSKVELIAFLNKIASPEGPKGKLLSEVAGPHFRLAASIVAEMPEKSGLSSDISTQLKALNERIGAHRAIGSGVTFGG